MEYEFGPKAALRDRLKALLYTAVYLSGAVLLFAVFVDFS